MNAITLKATSSLACTCVLALLLVISTLLSGQTGTAPKNATRIQGSAAARIADGVAKGAVAESTSVLTQVDKASTESAAGTNAVVTKEMPSDPENMTITPQTLSCTATPSCYLAGSGPGEVVAGQVVVSCNQATLLTASATICGNVGGCLTNSAAPPRPITSLGEGDASRGTAGSCSLSWSWGGTHYNQQLSVP